ncbi:MAG: hypothetical protein ACR2HD_12035 [Solirubrobacteraceae bacterium]|nr:MAG: hypothetical protein DLM63_12550 [Solirubrobacterales bacterium]
MSVVVLVLGIALGVFVCVCVLVLAAASRRARWRDALVYFGLADPPLAPEPDTAVPPAAPRASRARGHGPRPQIRS